MQNLWKIIHRRRLVTTRHCISSSVFLKLTENNVEFCYSSVFLTVSSGVSIIHFFHGELHYTPTSPVSYLKRSIFYVTLVFFLHITLFSWKWILRYITIWLNTWAKEYSNTFVYKEHEQIILSPSVSQQKEMSKKTMRFNTQNRNGWLDTVLTIPNRVTTSL